MDRLRLIGLLGWLIGCFHARRKNAVSRLLPEIDSHPRLATFEHSQIT